MRRKYFREKIGMVFQIDLKEGTYGYGQIATDTRYVFFDHQDPYGQLTPPEIIIEKSVIFNATLDRYVLKMGLWPILGVWPVKPENQIFLPSFGYNPFKRRYWIFQNGVGEIPCTVEETYGRELLASCEHGIIEQRLRDHFAGRPCYFIEEARARHLPSFPKMKEFYAKHGYDFHWLDEETPEKEDNPKVHPMV